MEKSRKPVISGAGQNLKTNGTSNYHFWGSGFADDNPVEIKSRTTGELLWSGTVKVRNGMAKAQLRYVGKKGVNVGELELVDVTVTNSDGLESDPHGDQVIVDGPL